MIEPVKGHPVSREDPKEAHVVYRSPVTWTAPRHRRSVTEPQERQGACGVKGERSHMAMLLHVRGQADKRMVCDGLRPVSWTRQLSWSTDMCVFM